MKSISHSCRCLAGLCALLLAALLCTVSGCATGKNAPVSGRPGAGLAEYTALVEHSRAAVDTALQSLDKLDRQTLPLSRKSIESFSDEVDRLASESVEVRARSQAMQTRGDAYFENWHENLAKVDDPAFRQRAEEHRTELQQRFTKVKLSSQKTRESFRAFLAGLRNLRSAVEKDPQAWGSDATRQLAQTTRQNGADVEKGLDAIHDELRAMTALVLPNGSAGKE